VTSGAAALLAVSRAEVRQLTDWGVDASRIHHIPNPVNLDEFRERVPRGHFRKALDLGAAPLVVFLGKITPRKRVDVLIRAFARLARPEARLIVAGNDMGALSRMRALVRTLDLGGAVTFTGLLSGPDRLTLLADADVVVYASEHEVFGLVPLEALLCGTPVIVADDSGCGEVVTALGGQHVVPAGDVDSLAHAIATVLDAPERSRAAAACAGARVRALYGDEGVARQLTELYRKVAGRA
jgi:glycosyltransferase involved in cell wall biosynthesis